MTAHAQKKQALLPVIVILFWFAQYVYIPYQTPYLLSLQVSEVFLGSILGAYGVTQLLLRLPIGVMADSAGRHKGFILCGTLAAGLTSGFSSSGRAVKIGPRVFIPVVFFTLGIYCILVPAVPFIPLLLALQFLPGMATGILFSNLTSEAMKGIPAEMKSTAMGFYQAMYALGITLFPMFTGKLIAGYSHLTAFTVLAFTSLAGTAVSIAYYHSQKNISKSFLS